MKSPSPARLVAVALAATLLLSACGGGASDTGSSSIQPVTPPAKSLTLQGRVVDAPVPNATVTATVGSLTFTTTADGSGYYSLPLSVPVGSAGFVTVTARGTGSQSFVQLVSLLGSFDALVAAAGADGVLTSSEKFATNVTNVSTAAAVLAQDANNGAPVTSDGALQAATGATPGQDLLDLATAIKLAVDSPANYPLPGGQSTTLSLAQNATARGQFIAAAQAKDPGVFGQTQAAIAASPDLTAPVSAARVPATLTGILLPKRVASLFGTGESGISGYTFSSDGTGTAFNGLGSTSTRWSTQGSTIQVTYDQPLSGTSYPTVQCNGRTQSVQALYTARAAQLAFLGEGAFSETITYTLDYADTAQCSGLPDGTETDTVGYTLLSNANLEPITAAELTAGPVAASVYDTRLVGRVGSEIISFNADGSGSTRILGKALTWSLPDSATLRMDFGGGVVGRYQVLKQSYDPAVLALIYDFTTPEGRFTGVYGGFLNSRLQATSLTSASVPGRYYQHGVQTPTTAYDSFALRFDSGGTGSSELSTLADDGTVTVFDSRRNPINGFLWSLSADGTLDVNRTVDGNGQYGCAIGSSGCTRFDWRKSLPLGEAGRRQYFIEQRRGPADGAVTEATPFTLLARFYDKQASGSSGQRSEDPPAPRPALRPANIAPPAR